MSGFVVVTGASGGIGAAIASALVAQGREVALVVRRIESVAERVSAWTAQGARVQVIAGDLASLSSARSIAGEILARCQPLDVLIHNAGVWPRERSLGPDGLERAFVVNHLAPFLLDTQLGPALAERSGRVVQVSAGLYPLGRIDPARTPTGGDFGRLNTYAATKRCSVMVGRRRAQLWRQQGMAVTLNAVHPGVVNTGLGMAGSGLLDAVMRVVKRAWLTPEQGARGPVHLATHPDLAGITGQWFDQLEQKPWHATALDEALTDTLWEQAVRLTSA